MDSDEWSDYRRNLQEEYDDEYEEDGYHSGDHEYEEDHHSEPDIKHFCFDDMTAVDSYGDDCTYYRFMPGECGMYDTADFVASTGCCGCGGGS